MTDLNIRVDMGRIQSSVQAAVRPAVDEALSAFDIKKAIKDALAQPANSREDGFYWPMLIGGGRSRSKTTLLDQLVEESIAELAKEYVRLNIQAQRGEIEEGFRKMLQGSANKLVKAFSRATEKALEDDWGFDFSVKVEHKTPARDYSDD